MYDDLQVWFTLVHKYVSNTAFIEDGRVYIRDGGIHEVPVYDPSTFVQFLNFHPHLLPATYEAWRNDETCIERAFCIVLFEQTIKEDIIRSALSSAEITAAEQSAMKQLITALTNLGFEITMPDECCEQPDVEIQTPLEQPGLFQSALFASLNK